MKPLARLPLAAAITLAALAPMPVAGSEAALDAIEREAIITAASVLCRRGEGEKAFLLFGTVFKVSPADKVNTLRICELATTDPVVCVRYRSCASAGGFHYNPSPIPKLPRLADVEAEGKAKGLQGLALAGWVQRRMDSLEADTDMGVRILVPSMNK